MERDYSEKIRNDLKMAINANGGEKHRNDWCQCDASVGFYPCEYCAIWVALDNFRKLLNIKVEP